MYDTSFVYVLMWCGIGLAADVVHRRPVLLVGAVVAQSEIADGLHSRSLSLDSAWIASSLHIQFWSAVTQSSVVELTVAGINRLSMKHLRIFVCVIGLVIKAFVLPFIIFLHPDSNLSDDWEMTGQKYITHFAIGWTRKNDSDISSISPLNFTEVKITKFILYFRS